MNNSKETKIDLEQLDRLLEYSESPFFGIKFDKLIPMVVLQIFAKQLWKSFRQ